jgi:hypothetical protein
MDIKEKRLFELTGAEFVELLNNATAPKEKEPQKEEIRGIANLAARLGVSAPTIQAWKNKGIIPYTQRGRFVYFDVDRVLEALNNK